MLIIYGKLNTGGIETFFLRLCKERYKKKQLTRILILSSKNSLETNIEKEIKIYAEVYYINDYFICYNLFTKKIIFKNLFSKKKVEKILQEINHIHVTAGYSMMVADMISKLTKKNIKITVGIYSIKEFTWGYGLNLPYFEKIHRKYLYEYMPKENVFLFSADYIDSIKNKINAHLDGASVLRLGVIDIDENQNIFQYKCSNLISICSVGRLVDFKTYNFWMIDVVSNLIKKGYKIRYDIYGDGPEMDKLKIKIKKLNLTEDISLNETFEYRYFNKIVSKYSLFVGSGTSIIQASSIGIPSIIAMDSIKDPVSYGYFKDFYNYDFNYSGHVFRKYKVEKLILDFIHKDEGEKIKLSEEHKNTSKFFMMDSCNEQFNLCGTNYMSDFRYSRLLYEISLRYAGIHVRLKSDSIFANRYRD